MKKLEILFFDTHLLVLNKPSGWLTQPNQTSDLSLEAMGKRWIKEQFQKKGNVFLEAVHRIDKPTSGIVLFARTSKALSRLNQAQRERSVQKQYLAMVAGRLPQKEGKLEHYLIHGSHRAYLSEVNKLGAKRCTLKYRAVKEFKGYTLLCVSLETGRYHQIRAQFAAIGCPIVGDQKYGSEIIFPVLALHHFRLQVCHPISHQALSWQAPLPDNWPFAFDNTP